MTVVTLVGSVKQERDWRYWTAELTKMGFIVFEAGLYGTVGEDIDQATWDRVTKVHQAKIDRSDIVAYIPKPNRTIGKDTQADIDYALERDIVVMPIDVLAGALKFKSSLSVRTDPK